VDNHPKKEDQHRIEIRIEFVGFRTGTVVVGMREIKIAVTGRQCDHQSGTSDV
jgi:hypothetical protein